MSVRLLAGVKGAVLACLLGGLSLHAAADPVTLTLYNGQHAATGIAIAKAFTDKTGIQVKIRKGGDGQLASQITEEGARSPADVIYTEESPPLMRLSGAGLLAPLDAGTLALVEAQNAGGKGDWVGITARARVLAYNPKKIDEKDLPKSLMDLSDPQWSGRFGFVPTSGAFLEQVSAVIKLKGRDAAEDWLTGLKAFGSIYTNNVTAMKAVENGEVDMALINNYYWYTLKKEKGELNSRLYFFGNQDPGALVTVSGAAVLKSSQHPKEAQQFVAFMLSEEGQKAILSQSAEYPARNGRTALVDVTVHPSALRAPLDKIHPMPFPGLNIDNLPFFAVIAACAEGHTLVHDWVYEGRAIHLADLTRLGADVRLLDPHRLDVTGPTRWSGAEVSCPPALRPAVVILLAMLAARGTSVLRNVDIISRGYEQLQERLIELGAQIETFRD